LLVTNDRIFESVCTDLEKLLEPGDIIVDAGNSNPAQTKAWKVRLAKKGIRLIGMGVSGGERGAWNGSAMMAGGDEDAWEEVRPYFEKIAGRATDVDDPTKDHPTAGRVGPDAAGHFVKIVHNGIEYIELELLSETYEILRNVGRLSAEETKETFEKWDGGELKSYLLDTAVTVLGFKDPDSGGALVEAVLPIIEQKGTGKWASEIALDSQTYAPAIATAVFERFATYLYSDRAKYEGRFTRPENPILTPEERAQLLKDLPQALYAARLVGFSESLDLMKKESVKDFDDQIDIMASTGLWRSGSILQGPMLDLIHKAYKNNPNLETVLDIPQVVEQINLYLPALRRVAFLFAGMRGIGAPAMATILHDIDHYNQVEHSGASLVSITRDFFGNHLLELKKSPGDKWHHDGTKLTKVSSGQK
jgi:6-phosphogluconate dehydrogenase